MEIVKRDQGIIEGSFLSILDRQVEVSIDQDRWQQFLLCSLLFVEHLDAPDIFFFISSRLRDHLQEPSCAPGRSLFEEALRRKLIVPYFRAEEDSFIGILGEIRKQGILGVLPEADEIARRLDGVVRKQGSFAPRKFPDSTAGEEYEKRAKSVLRVESLPAPLWENRVAREAWEISKPWRFELLDAACRSTKANAGTGLRRGDWMCEVGWALGWPREEKVNDIKAVLDRTRDNKIKQAAELFFQWMNECYQTNMALSLKAVPNFPTSTPESAIVPYSLLPPAPDKARHQEEISFTIKVPLPHVLESVLKFQFNTIFILQWS